jgi:hypothetical protein
LPEAPVGLARDARLAARDWDDLHPGFRQEAVEVQHLL